ncbi:DNA polymerase III subunit alpha [Terracoccus luteus]|uniref:DNA polymerase III subunit alpha n=1 Tax=Terracoccus luteus TaxID=53356 RepID=A0A839PVW6_9MICO|nr:DNA polymerase III subunit alpha [Terracoccus luteus]MBB2984922.1 error-prone DNA polymerase [Terracoccus luteus]MCP2170574.1 error-prone DNA polymerase [Terracoccus luteus]
MTDTFVHLHVASGYSMRYGTARPEQLVERAAAWGQPALALTDRDGLYGAVKFVKACMAHGIAPVLGVDLALEPPPTRRGVASAGARGAGRTPVRGGALVDPRLPRVTVLARGSGTSGLPAGAGWASLCRLVTATHLRGERGTPVTTADLVAQHATTVAGERSLVVLLGPDSDVGRAVLAKQHSRARAALERWVALLPHGGVVVELVCHGGPEHLPGSLGQAGRMLALAREVGVPTVLTAAVRHADPQDAAVVDVLDAARRLVALDTRHLDRVTAAGHLSPTPLMHALALDVTQVSGPGLVGGGAAAREQARDLVRRTVALATDCTQQPRADLGIGSVHLPEPAALGLGDDDPQQVLARRCRASVATRYPARSGAGLAEVHARLDDELEVISGLGYATYFLTVAKVCDLIREMGVRVAARGSGAGSVVNFLLGISGVDPMRHGLLMQRFCSPLRAELPDIDIDVESARRTEIYERILEHFGGERVTCVSMMDTYRVRHAIRDVGAALGLPPTEVDAMAKAFPHIAARNVRHALAELPELRASGLDVPRLQLMFDIVERLDGLPRHIALHPCGVVLSDSALLDRTPVEASWLGFPMSQFDKDDVEEMGLLKLDVLGIRMQSAMAHALQEVERVDRVVVDLDDEQQVPFDDEPTFEMIRSTRTLGCFQIESPGQRELIGKFGPRSFEDIIIDISLFRPGPVKSDMIVPFLEARQGWKNPSYLHPTLIPALEQTEGVVVFHEQVLMIVAETTGVTLAEADEVRRAMGSTAGQAQVEAWWRPAARARGYDEQAVDRIWEVLKAFASFGFCKAHAAAFALPTYQSAWLKAHHPAAFLSGVLTHDPGMYPKRLILDDARSFGVEILGLDVNASTGAYRYERTDDGRPGIRLSLADVHGISEAEVARIVGGQPYASLSDFWQRAHVSRPVAERLVLAGGFDALHDIDLGGDPGAGARARRGSWQDDRQLGPADGRQHEGMPNGRAPAGLGRPGLGRGGLGRRGRVTRRDLLLHVAELDRWSSSQRRVSAASKGRRARVTSVSVDGGIRALAAAQSQAAAPVPDQVPTQLALDLGDTPTLQTTSGLPEMTGPERVRAELEVLGLDASGHVVDFYAPMLDALGVTRARDLLEGRSGREVWVAGVKVATQTPPIRSGRRVVFLTLDDATGPSDLTFFEDVQGPYAGTVFHSWLLLCRGVVRRTGPRGVSIRATGAWELSALQDAWTAGGVEAVRDALEAADRGAWERVEALAAQGAGRGVGEGPDGRRVLVHASGFRQSPYADIKPAGTDVRATRGSGSFVPAAALDPDPGTRRRPASGAVGHPVDAPPRKLWHASPGSSGH